MKTQNFVYFTLALSYIRQSPSKIKETFKRYRKYELYSLVYIIECEIIFDSHL